MPTLGKLMHRALAGSPETRAKRAREARRQRREADQAQRDGLTDMCCEIMHTHWRDTSIDELLCTPADAIKFCKQVRKAACAMPRGTAPGLAMTDYAICKATINARKRGDLKRDKV